MRTIATTSVLVAAVASVHAFAPALFGARCTSTRLGVSSWGPKGPPHRWAQEEKKKLENPEERIQSYLPEPDYVYARDTLDEGTCLVSGLVKTTERTDQTVFDMLNYELSAFAFDKITAFVNDEAFAKKRLLSRSARYTGLLDKLDFEQAVQPDALPTVEQLEEVTTWVAYVDSDLVETTQQIATIARQAPKLWNLAILLVNANELDVAQAKEIVDQFQKPNFEWNIVAVGKLEDHPEGQEYYQLREFGTDEGQLDKDAVFSREEALRMLTDTLQLHGGVNTAYAVSEVYNVNKTEAKLIKGLREAGYARAQETDHMIRDGPANYEKAIEDFKSGNPQASGNYNNWWEAPQFQEANKEQQKQLEQEEAEAKDGRQEEVERIATEWAKREYFRKSMAGSLDKDMDEDAFVESVWDRALFEGDLKYRQARGETTDEETELADFKVIQEKKKETMLKRAQEELKDILDDDNDTTLDDDDEDDE